MMVLLAGCGSSVNQTTSTEDLQHGNWWEKYVVYYFAVTLDKFAEWMDGQYGLAILLMVIIVRTIILPLTIKQYKSSKAMQALQPEIKQIREKYKDSPQKMQEEMMKLYQANQVNPMAGCLPMIVQMPVYIALYNSIYRNPDIREHAFLWLKLGEKDPYYILPVIAAITTFVQSKMMQKTQVQPMPGMGAMLMIMPVMIFVMAINFPAALPLYWIYSNGYTIVQNYFLYIFPNRKNKNDNQGSSNGSGGNKNAGAGKAKGAGGSKANNKGNSNKSNSGKKGKEAPAK
ncbi:YidC/Oxa1 family membrane protein insertase [Paenibacillus protaetiae]|uniref:Membrane protein insertase YidC n=1 Tax=Paenibacillus protaetiae TaxID=2509456 RepID=A0A4P6F048_9BACL|nr:YidC/Oxa1 family membrane protein insertase [Paenibacillus protaetiae]QAY68536.1 membrane protein insertase YidC [Paenibacillus protaetiae]